MKIAVGGSGAGLETVVEPDFVPAGIVHSGQFQQAQRRVSCLVPRLDQQYLDALTSSDRWSRQRDYSGLFANAIPLHARALNHVSDMEET